MKHGYFVYKYLMLNKLTINLHKLNEMIKKNYRNKK